MNADRGSVSSDLLRILLQDLSLGQRTLHQILEVAGIDPALLQSSQQRLSADQFYVLWRAVEESADDSEFGLHLGELRQGLPGGHVLFSAMLNSATVGQALERYCRYHDIMADLVVPGLSTRGSTTVLDLEPSGPGIRLHRHHVECIFSMVVSILRHLSEDRFEGEVRFTHQRPANVSEHRRILGPSVRFAQSGNEIVLPRPFLDLPIPSADEELLGVLEKHAEKVMSRIRPASTWSGKVARQLNRVLCDGKPALSDIARRLAVSPRSLQSKLSAEGTSYQKILDTVRKDLATIYLRESEMTICEIAFLLGYSDQSAFHHSFKRQTGESPLRFRRRTP